MNALGKKRKDPQVFLYRKILFSASLRSECPQKRISKIFCFLDLSTHNVLSKSQKWFKSFRVSNRETICKMVVLIRPHNRSINTWVGTYFLFMTDWRMTVDGPADKIDFIHFLGPLGSYFSEQFKRLNFWYISKMEREIIAKNWIVFQEEWGNRRNDSFHFWCFVLFEQFPIEQNWYGNRRFLNYLWKMGNLYFWS